MVRTEFRYLKWFLLQLALLAGSFAVFGAWLETSMTNEQAAALCILLCGVQIYLCYRIGTSTKDARIIDRILVLIIPVLIMLVATVIPISFINGAEKL